MERHTARNIQEKNFTVQNPNRTGHGYGPKNQNLLSIFVFSNYFKPIFRIENLFEKECFDLFTPE